jgi:hypothetical protein
MKRIFISGALNGFSEETGFIDNVHLMLKHAGEVRKLGAAVYVPCNDILTSFSNGGLPHHEYYKHDLCWLEVCDALSLVPNPNNHESNGVKGELYEAERLGLPILDDLGMVEEFIKGVKG